MILPASGLLRTADRYGSYVIAASMPSVPAMIALAACCGSRLTTLTSLVERPFFFSIQASAKYGDVPGGLAATVLPFRSLILAMPGFTTMPSAPKLLSSWKICVVVTPAAFQPIHVSTVVAAHCTSPEAIARWRSFCGIFLIVTSRPFFLKIPASLASVSGANPVHPEIAMFTFTSSATAGAAARKAAAAATIPRLRMAVSLLLVHGLRSVRFVAPVRAMLQGCCINCAVRLRDLLSFSAALEAGNQFVGLAGIDQAHGGQRPRASPGVPFDYEARCAD